MTEEELKQMERERNIIAWEVEKRHAWVRFASAAIGRDKNAQHNDAVAVANRMLEEFTKRFL